MDTQRVVIPDRRPGLLITANKYTSLSRSALVANPLVLIFGHGTGHHKETWEPCIEHLFQLDEQAGTRMIAEIWSVDCQHHGEAAIVNTEYLIEKPWLPCEAYGDAFLDLIYSGHITDLKRRSVVIIGHSGGACAGLLAARHSDVDKIPFSSVIMVEPPMVPPEIMPEEQFKELVGMIAVAVRKRRESWPSRAAAVEFFTARKPWKSWTPRAIELFADHALRPAPTSSEPDAVKLCVSNEMELGIHSGIKDMYDALDQLTRISKHVPIHAVFGGKPDYRTQEVKDAICDPSYGRIIRSIHNIEGASHSVGQEKPAELADILYRILRPSLKPSAKL